MKTQNDSGDLESIYWMFSNPDVGSKEQEISSMFNINISILYTLMSNSPMPIALQYTIYFGAFYQVMVRVSGIHLRLLLF